MTVRDDDRGLLYGDALFETVAVRSGRIRWLDRHVARAWASGRALGFPDDVLERMERALRALVFEGDGLWRVTASRPGDGAPFGGGPGAVHVRRRALPTARSPRLTALSGWYWPDDPLSGHKTTSWLRWAEARRRAVARGFDDALLVGAGEGATVGEASAANVFVALRGELVTPPLGGVLPGVTRAGLLEAAEREGAPLRVRPVRVSELARAESILLTSAGVGVVAAAELDGRALGNAWLGTMNRWLEEGA